MNEFIKDLHYDLIYKFKRHGPQVEKTWRSLSQQQRENILRDGASEGAVLEHPKDRSLGNVYKLMPEWNLRDITPPSSDFLLDILKHRATTTLQKQYISGVNGHLGDHDHIVEMMETEHLQLINASKLRDCYTFFYRCQDIWRVLSGRPISPPKKLDIHSLIDDALDQRSSLEDFINLISTEPSVLTHEVNLAFFTRPELVADEKGRSLPVHTDKYISGAVFDVLHGAVRNAAIWNYISRLLDFLKGSTDKQFRAIALKELASICRLEYTRAQATFKRHVSTGSGGNKWFKRSSTVRKDGTVRISLKRNPESLTVENPQLLYMLRLCQDETDWSSSAQWLQKIQDLHRAHPLEKEKITEREYDALGDLAVIVTFVQSLSSVMTLPSINHKRTQMSIAELSALENELNQLRTGIDLSKFCIPIANFLEPNMASGALTTLDEYLLDKTGTKLGFLYEDLIENCVSNIHKQYEQQKAKFKQAKAEYKFPNSSEASELRIQQRRQKEKTRPAHSPIYEITPETATATTPNEQAAPSQETLKVKASTFATFSSLLSRSSMARGSISWDAFVHAMTDVGFSVNPKVGSIYTFVPPINLSAQTRLTLHRPHQSHIEGWRVLIYSCRLKRVYGWNELTFEVLD